MEICKKVCNVYLFSVVSSFFHSRIFFLLLFLFVSYFLLHFYETGNLSFISSGLIDFLVSSHPIALALREHVIFKIFPMMNPDGVFLGNYR